MPAGSTTTTASNSSPLACRTVSTTTRCARSASSPTRRGRHGVEHRPAQVDSSRAGTRARPGARRRAGRPPARPPRPGTWPAGRRRPGLPRRLARLARTERGGSSAGLISASTRPGQGHDLGRGAVVDRQLGQPPAVGHIRREHLATRRPPARSPVWATSPTIVMDRLGQRRISRRQAIGESSCASSTMTWPNAQLRSAAARCGRGELLSVLVALGQQARVEQVGDVQDLRLVVGAPRPASREPCAMSSATLGVLELLPAAQLGARPRARVSSSPSSSAASSSSGTSAGVQPPLPGPRSSSARSARQRAAADGEPAASSEQVGQQLLRREHRPQLGPPRRTTGVGRQLGPDVGQVGRAEQVSDRPARRRRRAGRSAYGSVPMRSATCWASASRGGGVEDRPGQVVQPARAAGPLRALRCTVRRVEHERSPSIVDSMSVVRHPLPVGHGRCQHLRHHRGGP